MSIAQARALNTARGSKARAQVEQSSLRKSTITNTNTRLPRQAHYSDAPQASIAGEYRKRMRRTSTASKMGTTLRYGKQAR